MTNFEAFKNFFREKTKRSKNYLEIDMENIHYFIVYVEHKNKSNYFYVYKNDIDFGENIAKIDNEDIHLFTKNEQYSCLIKWYYYTTKKHSI